MKTTPFEKDLARWEAGELTSKELRAAHPSEPVDGLLAEHARMSMLASVDVPDPAPAWARVVERIEPRRRSLLSDIRAALGRPALVGFATMIVMTAAGYAIGFGPVERGVDFIRDRIAGESEESTQVERDVDPDPKSDLGDERPGGESPERVVITARHENGESERGRRIERREEKREAAEEERDRAEDALEEEADAAEERAEEEADRREESTEEAAEVREDAADDAEDQADEAEDEAEDLADEAEDARDDERDDD